MARAVPLNFRFLGWLNLLLFETFYSLLRCKLKAEDSRWLGRFGDLDRIGRALDDPVGVVLGHPLVRSSGDLGNFIRMPSADQFDNRWHAFEGGFHTKFMF